MGAITNPHTPSAVVAERLQALRAQLQAHRLDAYLIPSADEHLNEYLPRHRERRAWVSGFTGSAGDFLLTPEAAWVFVDSRYHEQADYEVDPGRIQISKLGLNGQPTLGEQLQKLAEGRPGLRLGFDPFTLSVQQAQGFRKTLAGLEVAWTPVSGNLVDALWADAPSPLRSEVFALPESVTGQSTAAKLAAVREKLASLKADVLPLTKLDQIAWLFNLRGQDIPYNPVFMAYALMTPEQALLLTDMDRIRPEDAAALQAIGVDIQPYEAYADILRRLSNGKTVLIDPRHTTEGTVALVTAGGGQVKEAEHPVELMKAVKNAVEIREMQSANLKASRGKIRAWHWLTQQLAKGASVTEAGFRDAIEAFYAEEEGFQGLSFNTISGAGANASIVHYGTPSAEKRLEPGELFLIDSGCQFWGGTTDDTRTLLVGEAATPAQTLRFTEVLKAHINCALQKFPQGADGARLDGITRATLWQHGLDYGHGTGHGVGAFLNVHEGPNGIHKLATKPLEPGMINSIEPGCYEPGWGGIRLENLYVVVKAGRDYADNPLYGFESLTYIPFEPKLIDWLRLLPAQTEWLKGYYQAILEKIAPTLNEAEAAWLQTICQVPHG